MKKGTRQKQQGRTRMLDMDFVEFILTRSDSFLSRYATIGNPAEWRQVQRDNRVPVFADLEQPYQQDFIISWVTLNFGESKLPMLRKRYNNFLHRAERASTKVELTQPTMNMLDSVKEKEGFGSYDEAINWLLRSNIEAGMSSDSMTECSEK